MSEYIPKVGDEFEWSYKGAVSWTRAKANCVTDKAIGYEDSKGWIVTVCKSCNFRPIPTKADAEREKLVEIIKMFSDLRPESIAKEIQKAGFTIPKKVKQEPEIKKVWADAFRKAKADGIQSCLDIASQMVLCDQTEILVKSLKKLG